MKKITLFFSVSTLALAASSSLYAQTPTPQEAYKQAIAQCQMLSGEQAKNCRQDAGAALQDTRKHPAQAPSTQALQDNRLARCQPLPEVDRAECILQMTDQQDTRVFGSVQGGGILRETTITIPGTLEQPRSIPQYNNTTNQPIRR